MDIFYN